MSKKNETGLSPREQGMREATATPSATVPEATIFKDGPEKDRQNLPDAAQRALSEAAERRKQMDAKPKPPAEINGRKGPDPVRYGDWENKGIASDF